MIHLYNKNISIDREGLKTSIGQIRLNVLKVVQDMLIREFDLSQSVADQVLIMRKASGQPYLACQNDPERALPHVSISHKGQWIACLLSDQNRNIGVDVEDLSIQRSFEDLANYAFSKSEQAYLKPDPTLRFYRLWTAKEAIAKSLGCGLERALKLDLGEQLQGHSLDEYFYVMTDSGEFTLIQHRLDRLENHMLLSVAIKGKMSPQQDGDILQMRVIDQTDCS